MPFGRTGEPRALWRHCEECREPICFGDVAWVNEESLTQLCAECAKLATWGEGGRPIIDRRHPLTRIMTAAPGNWGGYRAESVSDGQAPAVVPHRQSWDGTRYVVWDRPSLTKRDPLPHDWMPWIGCESEARAMENVRAVTRPVALVRPDGSVEYFNGGGA
jgi:hypothetical protein